MTTTTQAPLLKLERVFDATPERLWSYWTDPKRYARWLNPAPLDLVIHEWDLRPGGKIRFDMPQPDGSPNPEEGMFHELVPSKRLVSGSADKSFLLVATFEPVGLGRTRLVVEVTGVPLEWHAGATEGWGRGFEKLATDLSAPAGGFGLVREFKAPPEKVWSMWTTKEGIMQWWAPSAKEIGFDFTVKQLDVRPGGKFAFGMVNKEHDLTNAGTYTVVRPHEELAWTWHFDIYLKPDEKPYDIPIRVTFERLANGGTRMRFTEGALALPGHTEGSREGVMKNLDQLEKALEAA